MNWLYIIVGILGLALLMVVHEGGHHLMARAFGMRVIRFSIGFGPALFRHQSRKSDTVYQVALIPFLAYVQIAGMNPLEEVDPDDKGSYANATLLARISAIVAGPLANYLFASVLFFGAFMIGGRMIPTLKVNVVKDSAAQAAQMKDGDRIVSINHTTIEDWEQMRKLILKSPGKPLDVQVMRENRVVDLKVTPRPTGPKGGGQIGVSTIAEAVPVGVREAVVQSVIAPAVVVEYLVVGLARIITFQEKPQLAGPVGIVKETGKAARGGIADYLQFLGILSAYLGGFNMVPFPALDGGRLMFLAYEAVTRRRPDAKVEASVHAVGLAMLLVLIAVVSVFDIRGN